MLTIHDEDYFAGVLDFAARAGVLDKLLDKLAYLSNYGQIGEAVPTFGPDQPQERLAWIRTKPNAISANCELHKDASPHSFGFLMKDANGAAWFNGGLIYSGPGDEDEAPIRLDGSFPALTVGIGIDDTQHDWSIHT